MVTRHSLPGFTAQNSLYANEKVKGFPNTIGTENLSTDIVVPMVGRWCIPICANCNNGQRFCTDEYCHHYYTACCRPVCFGGCRNGLQTCQRSDCTTYIRHCGPS